jgi:hypothetical protein
MLDGRQLRTLFKQFNGQYFGGKLPTYSVRVVDSMTWLGESGFCNRERKLIKIHRALSDDDALSCLLHEMAHAATTGHHGMPWKREMIRLRNAGAPLMSPDSDVDLDDWDGSNVNRTHFRGVVQDVLVGAPDITLSEVIRHFIRNEGGPPTIKAFLKKFPWAARVFKLEKTARAEYDKRRNALLAKLAAQPAVDGGASFHSDEESGVTVQ